MSRFLLILSLIVSSNAMAADPMSHRDNVRSALLTKKADLLATIPTFESQGAACLVAADEYRTAVQERDMWGAEVTAYTVGSTAPTELQHKAALSLASATARVESALANAAAISKELDTGYTSAYATIDEIHQIDIEIAQLDSRAAGLPAVAAPSSIPLLEVDSMSAMIVFTRLIDLPSEFDTCKRNRRFYEGSLAQLASR